MSLHNDIQTRGSSFYFRKAIPADIRPHFGGKREIIRSLGKDAARAKVEGRELSLQIERLFLTARDKPEAAMQAKVLAPTDRKRAEKHKAAAKAKPAESAKYTISTAFDAYQAERRLPPKTLIEYRAAIRRFTEIVADKPIQEIAKADARAFKEALLQLPKITPRKLRKASMAKIIATVGRDPTVRRVSTKTVQKALGAISPIMAWAESNGIIENNPFAKIRVLTGGQGSPSRLPYSDDDLTAIFGSPLFRGCLSKERRGEPGNLIIRDHSFWLPWLGLYSGCRLEEMCQMLLSDVRQEQGISFLDVNTIDEGKHLKTEGSVRRVPIHPMLIDMGFLDYVASLGEASAIQLFPDLHRDNRGSMSAMWSKFWGRYARKTIGITDRRKVFHSFRHSFKDACRAAQIPEEVHDALTGHSSGSVGRGYGNGVPLAVLADAIRKLKHLPIPNGES